MSIVLTQKEKAESRGIIPTILFGHMQAPRISHRAEYPIVKHTPQELGKLLTMKKKNKDARIKKFGKDAGKHLNASYDKNVVIFKGSF